MKKSEEYLKERIDFMTTLFGKKYLVPSDAEEYARLRVEEYKEELRSEKAVRFIENNLHEDNMVGFPFVSQNTALYALEINSQHMIDKAVKVMINNCYHLWDGECTVKPSDVFISCIGKDCDRIKFLKQKLMEGKG